MSTVTTRPTALTDTESMCSRVSAVIVSWNTVALLDACLRSLRGHGADQIDEIVVVDNASTDGSVELVRDQWPNVRLVVNDENRGYQRASNQAFPLCTGEYLLLINADAVLTADCLDRMLDRMATDPRAAVVGPRLVYGDGSWQRWTAGRGVDGRAATVSFLKLDRALWRHGIWIGRDTRDAIQCGWVSSACMLVRRAALDEIGPMDERFFAYMDDVDLCERARAVGWTVWYEPAAESIHLMGASSKRQTGAASPTALRNLYRYVSLHRGLAGAGLTRAVGAVGFGARALAHGALGIRSSEHRAAARGHLRNVCISFERSAR